MPKTDRGTSGPDPAAIAPEIELLREKTKKIKKILTVAKMQQFDIMRIVNNMNVKPT